MFSWDKAEHERCARSVRPLEKQNMNILSCSRVFRYNENNPGPSCRDSLGKPILPADAEKTFAIRPHRKNISLASGRKKTGDFSSSPSLQKSFRPQDGKLEIKFAFP